MEKVIQRGPRNLERKRQLSIMILLFTQTTHLLRMTERRSRMSPGGLKETAVINRRRTTIREILRGQDIGSRMEHLSATEVEGLHRAKSPLGVPKFVTSVSPSPSKLSSVTDKCQELDR